MIEPGDAIKSNKFVVPHGAVLASKLNPSIPRVWIPDLTPEHRAVTSTEFVVLTPKDTISRPLIYFLLQSDDVRMHLCGRATGTSNSHQRVNPSEMLSLEFVTAGVAVERAFAEVTTPMLDAVALHLRQNSTLAALRDTLLPKLLCGEIRIRDAEKAVEAHV